MESARIDGRQAVNGHAAEKTPTPSLPSQSAHELVSELSQLEYHLRAWSGIDSPGWEYQAGVDVQAMRARRQEVLKELSARALELPDVGSRQSPPRAGGFAPDEPHAAASSWAAKVHNLERARPTREVFGRAVGILMERHSITADEAFDVLRLLSMVTNRELRVVAAELVGVRSPPET